MSIVQDSPALPNGWNAIDVLGTPVFINKDLMVASAARPSGVPINRTSKISVESGTYIMHPQPQSMPSGWEQAIAVDTKLMTGNFVYHNYEDGSTQIADPRPRNNIVDGEELPAGWTVEKDEDGDEVFIDMNSGTKTYLDPRLASKDHPETFQRGVSISVTEDSPAMAKAAAEATSAAASDSAADDAWTMEAMDVQAFTEIRQCLVTRDKLPAVVTGKDLNRYTNILPTPRTRVRLGSVGDAAKEYVNANYIQSWDGQPREYIATMGPLPSTIDAFWQMVWENDSVAIVMITALMENGIIKCARYWPTVRYNEQKKVGDIVCGDIRIAVMSGQRFPGYIVTQLRLTKGSEVRMVSHYYYMEWPDHGVPTNYDNLLTMIKSVREFSKSKGVPTVVHCSAGIGRTGTYIGIDQCMQELAATGTCSPLACIAKMREARGGMVQHLQQYEFMYNSILEFVKNEKKCLYIKPKPLPAEAAEDSGAAAGAAESGPAPGGPAAPVDWNTLSRSNKAADLAAVIAGGQPEGMSDIEWRKLKRKHAKLDAKEREVNSIRRKLTLAEQHGELALDTISKASSENKQRPTAQGLFS